MGKLLVVVVAVLVGALLMNQFGHRPQNAMISAGISDLATTAFSFSSSSSSTVERQFDDEPFEQCEDCTFDEWVNRFYESQPIEKGEIGHFHLERDVWMTTENISKVIAESDGDLLPLDARQYELLDDEIVEPSKEEERCQRYGLRYEEGRTARRRIFFGSTIADDSDFILQTIATEAYDVFHTAAFVESNTTHTRTNRTLRFPPGSGRQKLIKSMFGTKTKVSVDYFVDSFFTADTEGANKFNWQHMQKQGILHRWKRNGMREDDVGLLADTDEFLSRDFLRALQICDIPQFQPKQDCKRPKVLGQSLVFESSPECFKPSFRWWHPDIILGECIELIGNSTLHKPTERTWMGRYSFRRGDFGRWDNWTGYFNKYNANETIDENGRQMYALWSGTDFRAATGGGGWQPAPVRTSNRLSTGYHCHNFFASSQEIRHKYTTYGEPRPKAKYVPLSLIHADVSMAVACSHGWPHPAGGKFDNYSSTIEGRGPIFFENPKVRQWRINDMQRILAEDEAIYGALNVSCNENGRCEAVARRRG